MKVLEKQVFRKYDKFGGGHFGASRGNHVHIGVDLVAEPGDYVYAPFKGEITKEGWAYNGADYRYIEVTGEEYRCRIFYAKLDSGHFIGNKVSEGRFLGVAQDIEARYPGITPHVHFELYRVGESEPLDPTEYLKKKIGVNQE